MIQKLLTNSTILSLVIILSSCSLLPTKQIEVKSAPIQLDIIHPEMPRAVSLGVPKLYVVSEAVITNPCVKNEEGKRDCSLGKENDWPEGYTYLDRFLDDMKKLNNGDVVFYAYSTQDYELMATNLQELRRYIREVQEVVIYYKDVTTNEPKE